MSSYSWEPTPFGQDMRQHFYFAPGYRNLNHGSFGTSPRAILDRTNALRDECESNPCPFIKYRFPELLDESRAAMSEFLGVPRSTIVFTSNATTGVNTVLRNITWNADGKDEIIQLDIIYGACGKTTRYICESNQQRVRTREVGFQYPEENSEIVSTFQKSIQKSKDEGFRPRVAIFDTISSNPGIRLPFKELAAICREEDVLSLVDAAHGIGQIDLNIPSRDPDFLVTNCHKWLYTPRGCAVFYVPARNQGMMRSTLPTSHGFVVRDTVEQQGNKKQEDFLQKKTEFETNFEFVGTTDNIAFLTIPAAIKWRQQVCGGEQKIQEYCTTLSKKGGVRVAEILGTRILEDNGHCMTNCSMINILLPLERPTSGTGSLVKCKDSTETRTITDWMQLALIEHWKTFMPIFPFQGRWWVRLSGQIYLDESDFEWAGWTLKAALENLEQETFV
ncbi:Pyridoxal phosphate-dependent transferase major region subdomain 1 [Penicillium malachiteum]|uniref:Pyridoxal phosphate-dependent transferase major region subdomain 1 n=1 Tax=Penicillium malachiteum TaxID=1324776 RepID=UPI002546A23B|nr:Pyridoxal phosphate-dependent transferase major region subdomain 1 [Penicillium malachiteum]KAJ5737867.1 Pyridoxal phosphate-dependent transferase major region subdomain 1 [Penicillium malachiteum]